MQSVVLRFAGRLGNAMFQFAHAKKRAELEGFELRHEPTILERIFTLDGHIPVRPDGSETVTLSGYFQSQADLIYTRADARRWFTLKPEIAAHPIVTHPYDDKVVAHLRRGDFAQSGYPLVSVRSYARAAENLGIDPDAIAYVSDDFPSNDPEFTGDLAFLPDFFRLVNAPLLLRANSSFSWWAGTLGHGRVFSPVIDGLEGGREHECEFVEGNWPRLSSHHFCSNLHINDR